MPDSPERLLADCVGVSAFDELNAAGCALVDGWRDENVNVIGHDDEGVEFEAALIAITEECGDKELGVCCSLEVSMLLECGDRDGVGVWALTDCGHGQEGIPQGLKPLLAPVGLETQG